jgi:hypothetical protein
LIFKILTYLNSNLLFYSAIVGNGPGGEHVVDMPAEGESPKKVGQGHWSLDLANSRYSINSFISNSEPVR